VALNPSIQMDSISHYIQSGPFNFSLNYHLFVALLKAKATRPLRSISNFLYKVQQLEEGIGHEASYNVQCSYISPALESISGATDQAIILHKTAIPQLG